MPPFSVIQLTAVAAEERSLAGSSKISSLNLLLLWNSTRIIRTEMLRNKPSMLKKNAPMENTRTDPIFTQEDREAEARRLAACICARGKTTIQCLRCGNLCFGRKFRPCPSHPKVCSICRG